MRLNRHGNFKVKRFQLFEKKKKDVCAPSHTVPHSPLPVSNARNGLTTSTWTCGKPFLLLDFIHQHNLADAD